MSVTLNKPRNGSGQCGFCNSGNHEVCAVGVKTTKGIFLCLCTQGGCEEGRRRCTYCKNRTTTEVDPTTWECFDVETCRSRVEERRNSNPLLRELREAYRSSDMAKIEKDQQKAERVAKVKEPTFCLVTGEPTKGGKFKPGMDARYVSEHVQAVMAKSQTKAQAVKKMKDDGVSETLIAKFEKQHGIAVAKAEKAVQAEKDKKAAKAEKATASS